MRLRLKQTISFLSVLLVMILALVSTASAQRTKRMADTRATPPASRNREIPKIVREIDARNVERTILKLVSFGTRNSLSAQDDPNRGIGAARDFLYQEFLKVAETSGGRMTVEKQSYLQEKAQRVLIPTVITNVVATLRGSQPESESASMWLVVTTTRCVPAPLMRSATLRERTMTLPELQPSWKWRE